MEEEELDGVMTLGRAYMWMGDGECKACFKRAKEGFARLIGENSAKEVNAAYMVASLIPSDDENIAEYRRLWEMAKVSLSDEAVTYDIATQLGDELREKGKFEEEKVFYLAALGGRRRVLGEEYNKTLGSLNNLVLVLNNMEDYEEALGYYQQALRVQERVLGKTHPGTLGTILRMGVAFMVGTKDYTQAGEMNRLVLDDAKIAGEGSQGHTKVCNELGHIT